MGKGKGKINGKKVKEKRRQGQGKEKQQESKHTGKVRRGKKEKRKTKYCMENLNQLQVKKIIARYPTGYPVSGHAYQISGIRFLDQLDIRPAGYPSKAVSGASITIRRKSYLGKHLLTAPDIGFCQNKIPDFIPAPPPSFQSALLSFRHNPPNSGLKTGLQVGWVIPQEI